MMTWQEAINPLLINPLLVRNSYSYVTQIEILGAREASEDNQVSCSPFFSVSNNGRPIRKEL